MRRIVLILLMALHLNALSQQATAPMEGFRVEKIDDATFLEMQGKSFPANCTVKRDELRKVNVLHCDATGETRRGVIICHQEIAQDLLEIFQELYEKGYPIERISPIDCYDANDELSMRANNTSCFCFRSVAGSAKLSKHAQGLAIDINPLYNPYVKRRRDGTLFVQPTTGRPYVDRSKTFSYKITPEDLCYRLFRQHGFTWGGSWKSCQDYQHFEK